MTVIGLQQDTAISACQVPTQRSDDGQFAVAAAPLFLDVHVLFVANFTGAKYADGLRVLSTLIAHFQASPVISAADAPGLLGDMDRLAVEFVSYDPLQLGSILASLGTPYLPCAAYRLRCLPFAALPTSARPPAVQ